MYAFIAQDEVGIVRNAIRRHLRAASLGTVTAQVREIERDKFVVASAG